jgi:hypothetical protein
MTSAWPHLLTKRKINNCCPSITMGLLVSTYLHSRRKKQVPLFSNFPSFVTCIFTVLHQMPSEFLFALQDLRKTVLL